jgi:hypothetical protein
MDTQINATKNRWYLINLIWASNWRLGIDHMTINLSADVGHYLFLASYTIFPPNFYAVISRILTVKLGFDKMPSSISSSSILKVGTLWAGPHDCDGFSKNFIFWKQKGTIQ